MRQRTFKIIVVFVWALAHGAWIGASWHAASEPSLSSSAENRCHSCRHPVELTKTASVSDAREHHCQICQLSTLLPDVPAHAQIALFGAPAEFASPAQLTEHCRISPEYALPPAHAPPVS